MRSPSRVISLLLCAAAVATAGCSRTRPAASPEPAVVESAAAARPLPSDDADSTPAARVRAEREAAEREATERERAARGAERMRLLAAAVYFELDRSDLSLDARRTLDRKLEILRADDSIRIAITGHADERGSEEYNVALGERRARAARRYLTQRGIDGSRIETSSFGEERPVCTDHDESCWARNRRAEFEATASSVASSPRG